MSRPSDDFSIEEYSNGLVRDEARTRAAANRALAKANKVHPTPPWRERVFSALDLQYQKFDPICYVVSGLLPDGLSMLAGRPKIGKSWLALELAIAVALQSGTCLGGREVKHGAVLYAACEDSKRRLQSRISKLIGVFKGAWPENLTLTTAWRRLDQGGVQDILEWIKEADNPRLVILDTLASVKPQRTNQGYQEDHAALEELHRVANDLGIAILVLHHQRKNDAEDPLDTISGTLGLAGCVDTALILSGSSQGMTLYVRGRDVEEFEHAVKFDKEFCRWAILGDAAEVQRSDTRKKILDVLKPVKPTAMGPSDIAGASGLGLELVKVQLGRMVAAGEVLKHSRGFYAHA